MEDRFKDVLDRALTDSNCERIILAVSGGVDSMVMVELMKQSKYKLLIAHCNFQLRGEESETDEKFIEEYGRGTGIKTLINRFDTEAYASDNGISIQMAARELRYDWFKSLAEQYNAIVATAHHANDVAETVLFNLSKGTGLSGLRGIREKDGYLLRPMLWAGKEEIRKFAKDRNLKWRQDSSNESDKYSRNMIRNKVIPLLEDINPSLIGAISRTAERMLDTENFLTYAIDQMGLISVSSHHVSIKKALLAELPGKATILHHLLRDYGFNHQQAIDIINSLHSVGAVFYSKNWMLNVDRSELILNSNSDKDNYFETSIDLIEGSIAIGNHEFSMRQADAAEYKIDPDCSLAAFDLNKLAFPLTVRKYKEGDSFVPLGMQGRKKLSDFLIDEKVSVVEKQRQAVLVSAKEVAWVVGRRISDHFKVTSSTKRVLEVRYKS